MVSDQKKGRSYWRRETGVVEICGRAKAGGNLHTRKFSKIDSCRNCELLEDSMKNLVMCLAILTLISGCATALVRNHATFEKTGPDGVTEKRTAINTIRAFGDRAVEQNLKGSLADATEEDLSAGISEANQKSEAGVIAAGLFNVLGKGIEAATAYFGTKTLPVAQDASVDVDTASIVYSTDGYGATPAEDGSGVYGRPSCSRCKAYKLAHDTEFVNIDTASNRLAMWAALRARGYAGSSVALPVVIGATGFTQAAQ